MANVKTIWIHTSGTPVTTGNYDIRVSPYLVAGIAGTHGGGGNWQFAGFDDSASYKLYNTTAGTEVTDITGGGTNTLAFYDVDLSLYLNKTTTSTQTVASRIDFTHASGLRTNVISEYSAGNGVVIDSLQVLDGRIEGSSPIKANSIIEYTGASGVTVDGVLLKDDIYIGHTGRALLAEANVLIVDANRSTDITGYVYNTIQEAIDYAQSQTPSTTSRWTIYIVPHKNTASYAGYAEALTLYKYIDLIGLGGFAMLKAYIVFSGTWTGGTFARLKNIVMRPAVDTGLTLRGLECDNCHFGIEEDSSTPTLSLENSQFTNCGFWKFGTVTNAIATTASNYIMNCQGNSAVTWDASDLVWGYDYINDASKYFKLT